MPITECTHPGLSPSALKSSVSLRTPHFPLHLLLCNHLHHVPLAIPCSLTLQTPHHDLSSLTSLQPPRFLGKVPSLSCSNYNPTWLSPEHTELSNETLISASSTYIRARSPGRFHFYLFSASDFSFLVLSLTHLSSDFDTLVVSCCHLLTSWPLLSTEEVRIWVTVSVMTTFPFTSSNFYIQADNSNNTQGSVFCDLFDLHDLYNCLLATVTS